MDKFASIASSLHAAYRSDTMFPDDLDADFTLEQAYDIQFELLKMREADGEKLAGWKVGLTAVAMQQQQGVHEPCFGHLLESGARQTANHFEFNQLKSPGFENELCIRIGQPIDGEPDFAQAMAAIDAVAPALEIIEKRTAFGANLPLAMAGNAQQHAYVMGDFVPFKSVGDLADVVATVSVNGAAAESASGSEVLGTPVNSVIWLAGKLAARGLSLRPGDLIMSGSFTRQYPIERGDRIQTDFSGIGAVWALFD